MECPLCYIQGKHQAVINQKYANHQVLQVLHDQMNRDDDVQNIVTSLDDILSFLVHADTLKRGPSDLTKQQIDILLLISKQVTECAYFISDYARDQKIGQLM
jgi:hypothetical protein